MCGSFLPRRPKGSGALVQYKSLSGLLAVLLGIGAFQLPWQRWITVNTLTRLAHYNALDVSLIVEQVGVRFDVEAIVLAGVLSIGAPLLAGLASRVRPHFMKGFFLVLAAALLVIPIFQSDRTVSAVSRFFLAEGFIVTPSSVTLSIGYYYSLALVIGMMIAAFLAFMRR